MKAKNILTTIAVWLPSAIIVLFFIPNALNKIVDSNQSEKIIENSTIMISTGVFLLIATALFLYRKTILIGTILLALYMTLIVFIHMYKEKPYEVAILIVISTVFASYIREPQMFHKNIRKS